MDWSRVRRLLDDAMWVLLGMLGAFAVMVGGIWLVLINLNTTVGTSSWDGSVPFIANCPPSARCVINSVPEQTPSMAARGTIGGSVTASPQPDIAGLSTGDRVTCAVHVERGDNNDGYTHTITTVADCRRE